MLVSRRFRRQNSERTKYNRRSTPRFHLNTAQGCETLVVTLVAARTIPADGLRAGDLEVQKKDPWVVHLASTRRVLANRDRQSVALH